MICKYCEEYDIDDYDGFIPGELCPSCQEYHIPDNADNADEE